MQVKFTFITKMLEENIHTYFLNTLWKFTRGVEEDKDSFIWNAFKVCKTFKVMSLKTHKLDVLANKTAYNLFYKDMSEKKEELQSVSVSKARAIILKEWS